MEQEINNIVLFRRAAPKPGFRANGNPNPAAIHTLSEEVALATALLKRMCDAGFTEETKSMRLAMNLAGALIKKQQLWDADLLQSLAALIESINAEMVAKVARH